MEYGGGTVIALSDGPNSKLTQAAMDRSGPMVIQRVLGKSGSHAAWVWEGGSAGKTGPDKGGGE